MIEGTWPKDDIRRSFVAGARWRHRESGLTWWRYTERQAEEEAEKRYGPQLESNEVEDSGVDGSGAEQSVIQNIADLIVSEAANVEGADPCRAICHIDLLVSACVMEMMEELKRIEREIK